MNDPKDASAPAPQPQSLRAWASLNVLGVFTAQLLIILILQAAGPLQATFQFYAGMLALLALLTCIITILTCLAYSRIRQYLPQPVMVAIFGITGFVVSIIVLTAFSTIWTWPVIDYVIPLRIYWTYAISFGIGAIITALLLKFARTGVTILIVTGATSLAIGIYGLLSTP